MRQPNLPLDPLLRSPTTPSVYHATDANQHTAVQGRGQDLPATSELATFHRAAEAEVDYSAFLEDGLFDCGRAGDDDELSAGGGIAVGSSASRSAAPFASTSAALPTYRASLPSHPAPSSSTGASAPPPGDSLSTSTSPPFPALDPFRSLSMHPPPSRAPSEASSPYSWGGAVNGGFTADGGAGAGGVQQRVPGYYTVPPTDALALGNHFFSNLSESHPDCARIPDWTSPSNMASQSYSGPSSFSSAYPHAYGAPMAGITASSVTASNPFQQPVSPGLAPPSSSQNMDHSLLALHRSLDVQAQGRSAHSSPYGSLDEAGSKMREGALKRSNSSGTKARGTRGPVGGAPGSTASSAASRFRYKTHPAPQGGPHGPYQSHSALTSPSVSPPLHYSNHPLAPGTFQRALPALPRRTSSAVSAASSTVSTPQPSYSMPPAFPSLSLSRASSVLSPTPPISRPVSPRIPGVDYGFTALEKDLDLYASGGFTAASAQSPHAMAGYGGRGYESPQLGGDNTPSPNMIANVLGESIFGSQSARSPTETAGENGDSNGAGSRHATAWDSATTSNKVSPNSGDVASPTGSTSIDDETGEALSKKDPISAQVWRMFNKAKTTLPNGARMENLTWRLMSMTLKKRRQETAALEAEAAAAGLVDQSAPSPGTAAEEADEVGQLRGRTGRDAGKGKWREGEVEVAKMDREDEGRGRKGRTPTSIEASPEVEEDFMDWRAKSQSRSRSRAPDVAMDWRAASRSRSRAPDFRVARPPSLSGVEVSSATAQLSRFHNDTGGRVTATEEDDKNRISFAESLGLSPGADFFASPPGVNGTPLDYGGSSPPMFAFPPDSQSPEAPTTDPNLSAIEETLNQLITLQSIAASSAPPSSVSSPWITPSGAAPSSPERVAIASPSFSNVYPDPATSGSHPGYGFSPQLSSIVENGANVSAEQQFQQIVNGRHQLSGMSSLPNGATAPRQAPPSAYANAINLAQISRPFSFSPATASGLSLARPSQVLPETSQPLSPDLNLAPAPPYMYASSAPVHHHNFPHPPTPYGAGGESPALYDYFQSHRDAMATQHSYGSPYGHPGIPHHHLHAPMHVNPSQLLNNLQGPPYDSDNSSWALSPHSGNDSSRNGTPSPPGPPKPFHNSMSSSFDPNYRIPSSLGMRSSSTPDLVALAKSKAKGAAAARTQLGVSSKLATGSNPAANEADVTDDGSVKCLNCSTTNTPLWRRDAEGRPLCNACGLFRNLHGVDRPATLNTGVIKKRNRARGPKELQPKKSGAGRATGRRNSLTAAPARAVPYPPTSVRTTQP